MSHPAFGFENAPAHSELYELLALACLRLRARRMAGEIGGFFEKSLDDVVPRGRLRRTENRTSEKGADLG